MINTDIKQAWYEEYRRLSMGAERDPMSVPDGMLNIYDRVSNTDKWIVHSILDDWLQSDDSKMQYDAMFIIRNRKIHSMRNAIERAIAKFALQPGPEAYYYVNSLAHLVTILE